MKNRLISLPLEEHFFLFGARNTGKSTLIKQTFQHQPHLYIDLLNLDEEAKYRLNPQTLKSEILALASDIQYVIIDEIQKIPNLLDVVHSLIEETNRYYILTGSSARKLKYGHANLLAGRALVRNLYPFSFLELGEDFQLETALRFGMLPKIYTARSESAMADFLRAYAHTYLKEEIWAEHLIRKLEPFQHFLEVAAQTNGQIVNAANLARDVGVDAKSIAQYFSILEDTLIGLHLPAFHHSFRKRLMQKPKFYFFDCGVVRALARKIALPLIPATYDYGNAFEHFIILECYKLVQYFYPDYRLSYLNSHDGLEIDLVVERPGLPILMIEIKSTREVREDHLTHLKLAQKDFPEPAEYVCLSQVERALNLDDIMVYPWQEGIKKLFAPPIKQ